MIHALLDMPVSYRLIDVMRKHGHDGIHVSSINLSRAPDEEIIAVARNQGRIIITADLDYPRILALSAADSPGVILFRGGAFSEREMAGLLDRVLTSVEPAVLVHSICVVDKKRIRIAHLPLARRLDD